jgi:hypothetical protein
MYIWLLIDIPATPLAYAQVVDLRWGRFWSQEFDDNTKTQEFEQVRAIESITPLRPVLEIVLNV